MCCKTKKRRAIENKNIRFFDILTAERFFLVKLFKELWKKSSGKIKLLPEEKNE